MTKFLKFWGTRGSCPVSGKEYLEFGGNTACLELQYKDTHIIFDAGTGIRPLGKTLKGKRNIHLFLSHLHLDHLTGLPFFDPLYRDNVHITIWAPLGPERTCKAVIQDLLSREFFPVHLDEVHAELEFRTIYEETPVTIGDISIDFHHTKHPGLTYCFKIKTPKQTISYITDNEIDINQQHSFMNFHKNVDLFIHEAQYTEKEYKDKKGWGHSSLPQVFEMIQKVEPKKWCVTHYDPTHTDDDLREMQSFVAKQKLPCEIEWARDHHIINLI